MAHDFAEDALDGNFTARRMWDILTSQTDTGILRLWGKRHENVVFDAHFRLLGRAGETGEAPALGLL